MNFSENLKEAINYANGLAQKSGGLVGTEHILCGLIHAKNGRASKILQRNGIDESAIPKIINIGGGSYGGQLSVSERAKRTLFIAEQAAGGNAIGTEHVLYAILGDQSSYAVRALASLGANLQGVADDLNAQLTGEQDYSDFSDSTSDAESYGGIKELENLGVELTSKAKAGKLDPVIGRSKEIDRIIQILSRRTKNNPVLIGEAGVGKSAIVEGLAQAIVAGTVPEMLKDKKVFSLDMSSVLAGTKYRGDFEKRLQDAIKAIKKDGNIIVFIDEIHTIVGSGSTEGGSVDAANILKPLLARGELQTIGATTLEEYRKYIEKDAALERRFQPVIVDPPSVEDTILILKGLREKYEQHHGVAISDEAIQAAAVLSDRYISDRFLPDKAIDLIDEACSKKRITNFILPSDLKTLEEQVNKLEIEKKSAIKSENFEKAAIIKKQQQDINDKLSSARRDWESKKSDVKLSINDDDVAEIVSAWTSVPVVKLTETESQRLLNLESILRKRVIGQDEAVESVSKAVRRARAGLKDPNRPIGSFIFLGPTGVGKTELTKALAEAMFGDESLMVRFDMSEYMDKISVSKLIGSAPGYVGFEEGGQLTEKVRRKPYSVILFDEIEKAHPDVFNILLQILDDGRLSDSHGRTVNFKNTIIIMTSNIGASEIGEMSRLGFGASSNADSDYEKMKEKQMEALKRAMRPEFINRIDDIIIFHKLEKEQIAKIADLLIANLAKRLADKNISISVSEAAKEYIVKQGYDPQYGARPLRRAIQRLIEDRLSEEILAGTIALGDAVNIDFADEKLSFNKKDDIAATESIEQSQTDSQSVEADELRKGGDEQ